MVTLVMLATGTENASELEAMPSRRICTVPDCEPVDTLTTISVSLHVTTAPGFVPSHATALPCALPNPDPSMVTCMPAAPPVGDAVVITGGPPACDTNVV